MALNTATYYSNSIQGIPQVGADCNIYRVDSAPKYAAGYLIERADGARFRYVHIGTAANADTLVGPTTATGGATYNAVTVVAPASAQVVPQEYPILAGQVGSHYVEVTVAAIVANKYMGSYLVTTEGTGLGHTYRIVGNTATGNPASGNLRIQLAEPIQAALTANTGTIIVSSQFTDLANTATSSSTVVGILKGTVATAPAWAWVQTKGISGCQEDGANTVTAGQQLIASPVTAGAYAAMTVSPSTLVSNACGFPLLGYSVTPAGAAATKNNKQGVIFLVIE